MILSFEGIDKVGKSTLVKRIHEETRWEHQVVDRFSGTTFVYGMFRHRDHLDFDKIIEFEKQLVKNFSVLLIYLEAENEDIITRMKRHNETDILPSDIDELRAIHEAYIKRTPFRVCRINTSDFDEEECIRLIVQKIKEVQEDDKEKINTTFLRSQKVSHNLDGDD